MRDRQGSQRSLRRRSATHPVPPPMETHLLLPLTRPRTRQERPPQGDRPTRTHTRRGPIARPTPQKRAHYLERRQERNHRMLAQRPAQRTGRAWASATRRGGRGKALGRSDKRSGAIGAVAEYPTTTTRTRPMEEPPPTVTLTSNRTRPRTTPPTSHQPHLPSLPTPPTAMAASTPTTSPSRLGHFCSIQ